MYKCPRCDSVLRTIDYEGMEIETCPGCEGEWLDAGELGHIVRTIEKTFTAEEVRAPVCDAAPRASSWTTLVPP